MKRTARFCDVRLCKVAPGTLPALPLPPSNIEGSGILISFLLNVGILISFLLNVGFGAIDGAKLSSDHQLAIFLYLRNRCEY